MVSNRFHLNVNNPITYSSQTNANISFPKGDLRNIYSNEAKFYRFQRFLADNGMSYSNYKTAVWNAKMAEQEQKMNKNASTLSTITDGIGTIFNGIKTIFKL